MQRLSARGCSCRGEPGETLTLADLVVCLQGFKEDQVNIERFLNLRYDGTDVAVMTQCTGTSHDSFAKVCTPSCLC